MVGWYGVHRGREDMQHDITHLNVPARLQF